VTTTVPTRTGVSRASRGEYMIVFAATLAASLSALWWSWANHAFLLYGDAEAHMHIARRLFDSHRPGITQLGSVWLPLPHLLLVPFIAVAPWWRSGFGPAIPGAACYLLACTGLYRLARRWLSPLAASLALVLFACNANLLYLQTTAMTEPLFLCELIWAVLLMVEWYEALDTDKKRAGRLMWWLIAVLAAAVYTRYDGWILGFGAWLAMAVCLFRRGKLFRPSFIAASIVLLLAPVSWMIYNAVVFGDWLDFMRGPYSAYAIEQRTSSSTVDPHPGWHNLWVSLVYYVKASEMDVAALGWGESIFTFAAIGTAWGWLQSRKAKQSLAANPHHTALVSWAWTLFLWLPLPFYDYSVSYGSVPIFLPVWKPFSWYNTRYGMELLPAFALFFGFVLEAGFRWLQRNRPLFRRPAVAVLLVLFTVNFALMLRQKPLVYEEGQKNYEARGYYNTILSQAVGHLHQLDPKGLVLMDTSTYSMIVPLAGMTYHDTLNESDKQFYKAALAAPAQHADIVLAYAGSEIAAAVKAHPEHLRVYRRFLSRGHGWDQLDATLYVTDTFPLPPGDPVASAVPGR
jgi:hypothetical protein